MLTSFCFAYPDLEKYLQNDLELKRLALEVKKTEIASQETIIDNGINVKLSTGTISLYSKDDNINVSFNPSITTSVPALSNLGLTVSSSIEIDGGKNNSDNTKISLSADIISGNSLSRKLKLMSAERSLLKAKRLLQDRALEAEKEYYLELKNLFTSAVSIIQSQKNLYDDKIDFQEIKAKGFSESSSKYRQAKLKVLSDEHDIEIKKRNLEHDCAVFAKKCGTSFGNDENPSDFLPKSIQNIDVVDIDSFKKEAYKDVENAEWTHKYNTIERKSNKDFTLSANAGYTLKNPYTNPSSFITDDDSDTVDLGASVGWKGLTFDTGVSFPTNQVISPIYSFSASLNPSTLRKSKLTTKKNSYSEEEELIEIESALDSYETSIVDQKQSIADIKWSKKTNTETYNMYFDLEKDLAAYFKAGIITESEYLSAFANKEQYRIQLLINDIEMIIYNNTTKLLFCRDEEIKG